MKELNNFTWVFAPFPQVNKSPSLAGEGDFLLQSY